MWCSTRVCLRPPVFQLYINDIVNLPLNGCIILYADDAVVYTTGTDPKAVIKDLQHDLDLISLWMRYNKLAINISKSKFMVVGTRIMLSKVGDDPDIKLSIGNIDLQSGDHYEYLGVKLDNTLSMDKAVANTFSRVSHKIYLF